MQIERNPKTSRAEKRSSRETLERLSKLGRLCAEPTEVALSAFLLSLVRWFGLPSPFAAAFLLAQDARGYQAVFPLLGLAASFLLRMLWGVSVEPWVYAGYALVWSVLLFYRPRGKRGFSLLGALAMLPQLVASLIVGDVGGILAGAAAVPLCMGLTLWLRQGLDVLEESTAAADYRDKACCALLLMLLTAGSGYLQVFSVNLGYIVGAFGVIAFAHALGGLSGSAAGMLVGLALSLSGHDCRLIIAFGLGGWVAGLCTRKKRRWLTAGCFCLGSLSSVYLMPIASPMLPLLPALLGAGLFVAVGDRVTERCRAISVTSLPARGRTDQLFVQTQLEQWETALRSMADALPRWSGDAADGARELSALLCADCSERDRCFGQERGKTERRFRELWDAAEQGEAALNERARTFRGDCIRLHQLNAVAEQVRRVSRLRSAAKAKAHFQREMTLTHIRSMADTIGNVRHLTCGETLADMQAGFQITKALHELRFPAELCYARRVDGHLQAALLCDGLAPLGKAPERLIQLLAREHGLQMSLRRVAKNRLELEELPLYSAELGVASVCAGQRSGDDAAVSGDAISVRQMYGGRYVIALSDGMGHGRKANAESHSTLELLMLSLEAGYTHQRAITAVNGMMLSATDEERFATVDLFDLDLWTGEVENEKLGACASYLVRGNYLKKIEGSSLPLGILESIAPTSQRFRLHSGDILIIVSDGVTDVLPEAGALEGIIGESVFIHPQRMADAILRNALLAADGTPKDDMTVAVLLLVDQNRSNGR